MPMTRDEAKQIVVQVFNAHTDQLGKFAVIAEAFAIIMGEQRASDDPAPVEDLLETLEAAADPEPPADPEQ